MRCLCSAERPQQTTGAARLSAQIDLEILLGALARQVASGLIGLVVECLYRLIDAFFGRWTDVRFTVDHTRYGLDGNARELGYVENGWIWHGSLIGLNLLQFAGPVLAPTDAR